MSLIFDLFTVIMFIVDVTLFFWRAPSMIKLLRDSPSDEWKEIIGSNFYDGGVQFGSFMALLLIKWPVVFTNLWYRGTDQEDKSTWAEIFVREFTPKTANTTMFSDGSQVEGGAKSDHPSTTATSNKEQETDFGSQNRSRSKLTDDKWKAEFRRDLQNIGFEFDEEGEIKKFPPTEMNTKTFVLLFLVALSAMFFIVDASPSTTPCIQCFKYWSVAECNAMGMDQVEATCHSCSACVPRESTTSPCINCFVYYSPEYCASIGKTQIPETCHSCSACV
eukprot:gene14379-16967_t